MREPPAMAYTEISHPRDSRSDVLRDALRDAPADVPTDEIVHKFTQRVKRIAHHLIARLPQTVQIDDLVQAGMIGLLEASRKYDADKGASFETYAGIRIRGAMLDEVRRGDWAPRSVYRSARRVAQAIREVECASGREASHAEVARAMGITSEIL